MAVYVERFLYVMSISSCWTEDEKLTYFCIDVFITYSLIRQHVQRQIEGETYHWTT